MQAKFRFIQNDDVGHCLGRLQKQGGQGNETDRSVGELVGIETIVRGRIIYPPERNDTTHGLQIEVLELGNYVTDIVNNPVVGILVVLPQEQQERRQIVSVRLEVIGRLDGTSLT